MSAVSPAATCTHTPSRPDWTAALSAISTLLTTLIAAIGLPGLWLQFQSYNEAAKLESDRRVRDAYAKLYAMDIDVWKVIGQSPALRDAFTNDKKGETVKGMSASDRARFDATCQMMGDLFEYYLLIEPDLKGDDWATRNNCWCGYINMIHQNSSGFREYVRLTEAEWTTVFRDRLKAIPLDK